MQVNTMYNYVGLAPQRYWVLDIDGNILKTYKVGKYLITENLKTEHYNDGTPIPIVEDEKKWGEDIFGAMCYYNNNREHKQVYGALYNFYAVRTGKLAPEGFRVPTDGEWKEIEIALGMSKEGAEETGWRGKGIGKEMEKALGVVYSGYRYPSGGGFCSLGTYAFWWSSSVSGTISWDRQLNTSYTSVCRHVDARSYGLSVRCVRELTIPELLDFYSISYCYAKRGAMIEVPYLDMSTVSDEELIQELRTRGFTGEVKRVCEEKYTL